MKRMMSWTLAPLFLGATLLSVAWGADARFNASQTFEFDPDHTKCPVAFWRQGLGEHDSPNCKTTFGLHLEKNCPTPTNAAAGAVLHGLEGVVVELGDDLDFDIKAGSPCTGGSPRFNVSWSTAAMPDGFSFVGGCGNCTQTPASEPGWTHVVCDLQNPAQAFPPVPPGATIDSVALIADEEGVYNLDNISFRDQVADKPGISGPRPVCP
jgi:hypothetical protein